MCVLSVASEEHVGKVRGWVENRVSALSEGGANDKGTWFPLALPFEAEVVLAARAEPDEEARSEAFGVGSERLPCGDMVLLKRSGTGGLLGVEVRSPELDNDDVGALFRSGAEGLHGGLKLVEKDIRACVQTKLESNRVEVGQPGDGMEGVRCVAHPKPVGSKSHGTGVWYHACSPRQSSSQRAVASASEVGFLPSARESSEK